MQNVTVIPGHFFSGRPVRCRQCQESEVEGEEGEKRSVLSLPSRMLVNGCDNVYVFENPYLKASFFDFVKWTFGTARQAARL